MDELPINIYSNVALRDIYVQKGKEYKNPVSHMPQPIFKELMDQILSGIGYRDAAEWLNNRHSLEIPSEEIKNYIELYVPKETREQITLCSEFLKEVKVNEVAVLNDLIKCQYDRIKTAYKKADDPEEGEKKPKGRGFNFEAAIDLLYKMLAKSVELKQSLGLLPRMAEKKEVKTSALEIKAKLDGKSLGIDQRGVANVLRIANKLKENQQ